MFCLCTHILFVVSFSVCPEHFVGSEQLVNDEPASITELTAYLKMVYAFDVMALSTSEEVAEAAAEFNITMNSPENLSIEKQRKEFIHRICRRTNIYVAPIEGGTRLACARALMTDTELPATTVNKLTFPGNVSVTSPIFTTRIAVSVYGPGDKELPYDAKSSDGWEFNDETMIALKRISQSYRDTLDASATSDISAGYVELIRYARVALEETNVALDGKYTVDKEKHVVGTTPSILAKAKVVEIPKNVAKLTHNVLEADMGPFEHLFNDYLPKIAKWWMQSYGKHMVKRLTDEQNKRDNTDFSVEKYMDVALNKIKHYASCQNFWLKTTRSKSSQGEWTKGIPSEVMGLMNFAALCLGNEFGMHRASRFIDATKENAFKKRQRSVLDGSLLSKDKFLDAVLDMIREATKVLIQKLSARVKGRRPIATAFFAQAMAYDVFTFIETYGPDPFELPHAFSEVIDETDKDENPLYAGLFDVIFQTYPRYLDNVLPKGFESSCLLTAFNQIFKEDDGFFPDSFPNDDWKTNDKYIAYFSLQSNPDGDLDEVPLSLTALAASDDDELAEFYREKVEPKGEREVRGTSWGCCVT